MVPFESAGHGGASCWQGVLWLVLLSVRFQRPMDVCGPRTRFAVALTKFESAYAALVVIGTSMVSRATTMPSFTM